MENAQVVDILYIALLEIKLQTILPCAELQSIERFCLGFADRRYGAWPSEASVSGEKASEILDQELLLGIEVENWPQVKRWLSTEAKRNQSV